MIRGGYVLQPRIIKESDIAVAVPCVREVWNYLLREANSSDKRYAGFFVQRGQLFRDYKTIREDLAWFVGYRKVTYNENQVKKAMKFLRDTGRITTMKEPGGVLVTICNYGYYQSPKNYERTNERTDERTKAEPLKNQTLLDNNKNDKKLKNSNIKDREARKRIFATQLEPYLDGYSREMINEFYAYWTEHGLNDQKMRFEKEKSFGIGRRLSTWCKKQEQYEKNWKYNKNGFTSQSTKGAINGALDDIRS
nr:hypothetical protein [uncultured Draconibacterium sp.]